MRSLPKVDGTLRVAIEAPTGAHNFLVDHTDYDFIIGSEASGNAPYRNLFTGSRRYRILDNGAFEGNMLSTPDLIHLAETLSVDEIVVPDVINDGPATVAHLADFKAKYSGPALLQVVPQGSTLSEWLEAYIALSNDPRVSVIGISYSVIRNGVTPQLVEDVLNECSTDFGIEDVVETVRLTLIHILVTSRLLVNKPIHLLGLSSVKGLPYYVNYPFIRSIDTSFPVMAGISGSLLNWQTRKPAGGVNYRLELNAAMRSLITINCARFREMCQQSKTFSIV